MAVQAVGRTPDLEAPLSMRLGSDSSAATTSSSTFGSYSGGHLDQEQQQQQQQLWLEERQRRDGRPAYASEGTDLSTLIVTDSRQQQRDEFDNEEDFSASDNSESTLSADDDNGREAGDVGDAAGDDGLLPGYATDWDGVVNGNLGGMLSGATERYHHLIETDRTSVSSSDDWADCEYELIAAQRVNDLFEQIDSLLYRQEPFASPAQPPPDITLEECAEWRSAFPHLRLRGSQLAAPRDPGFAHQPAPLPLTSDEATPRPADDQAATDLADAGLQLIGRALAIRRPSTEGLQPAAADLEELLAQEGCVEEAIAIDDGAAGDEPQRPPPRRSRSVAPQQPVTPSLALRDAAQCTAFDSLWARLVAWSRPLFLERLRRSRRFSQQQQRGGASDDDEDDETVGDEEDEPAGPLHRIGPGFQQRHSRQAASATGAAVDPRLPGDLAGLLSISSKTLQQRSEPALPLATAAPSATASVSGLSRRPPGRLAPVDRPKTPQQQRYGGQHLQQPLLHHQQPQLPLHPQHHPQHAGLFAAFTRSGTLPPLHDRRGPQLAQQQASQPHHPLLRAGAAASVRPGSGGRPGAYSSLDWPTPSTGAHFGASGGGGGRSGGPRANSGLHHRQRGIHGIHGRALAAAAASVAPTELDALYEAAPAMRTANSLQLGPATSSYQQIRRSRPVGLIRK